MITRSVSTLLGLVLISVSVFAADTRSWAGVRELTPGKPIEVTMKQGKRLNGSFVSSSEESIVIRTKDQESTVPRADVSRVELRKGSRAVLLGAGIGAGAGAVIGYGAARWGANESGGDFAGLTPAVSAIGAVIGALTGAIIGYFVGHHHSTVYRAS